MNVINDFISSSGTIARRHEELRKKTRRSVKTLFQTVLLIFLNSFQNMKLKVIKSFSIKLVNFVMKNTFLKLK